MRHLIFIFIILLFAVVSKAQPANCTLKPPQLTIHFGTGNVRDPNSSDLSAYQRVRYTCPSDGYYSFASYTYECFGDDWHTLPEDHTAGDADGNMLLVNAAPRGGVFLSIPISGLKSNTVYEIGLFLINLCKPTKKCPFLLLPQLNIRLQTPEGKTIANIVTGDLPRVKEPRWTRHHAFFTTPASTSTLMLVMMDNASGGCGNDFALDDITFRECVKQQVQVTAATKKPAVKQPAASKPPPKKVTTLQPKKAATSPSKNVTTTQQKKADTARLIKPKTDTIAKTIPVVKPRVQTLPPPPQVLKTRENELFRRIETETGEIKIDVYDNADIDGDTVSIYHNNVLIRSRMRLSQKPITITIMVDPSQSHHEIIMVAENLGSIPPNTSVMIITTATTRHEVFITSSEQKNAKVVFDLKK